MVPCTARLKANEGW